MGDVSRRVGHLNPLPTDSSSVKETHAEECEKTIGVTR